MRGACRSAAPIVFPVVLLPMCGVGMPSGLLLLLLLLLLLPPVPNCLKICGEADPTFCPAMLASHCLHVS